VTGSNTFSVGTGTASFGGNISQTGATTFSTGTGSVSLNGNTSITGSNTFSTGTGAVSLNGNTSVTGSNTFTTGTGAVSLGGNTTITGTTTLNGTQLTNLGATLNTATTIADLPAGGAIGTAAATVNIYTSFNVNQTTAGQTLSLPSPTTTTAGRVVYVLNVGSTSFTMHGVLLSTSSAQSYLWNGSAWVAANIDGAGSGVTTIGAIDSQTKSANGAVISGNNLYLQTADASNVGLVSTSAQTFAGSKTFNAQAIFSAAGTALSVTNNASIGGTGTIGTLSVTKDSLGVKGLTASKGLGRSRDQADVTGISCL
jgi:hypothetical protein